MSVTRVLLADDHAVVRAGVRFILEEHGWLKVVAEACDGRAALGLMGELHPDIALLDIAMPGLSGLEVTQQAKIAFPAIKVVILSMHATRDFITQALSAGACGYLLKDAAADELELALRTVVRGETYLSAPVTTEIASSFSKKPVVEVKPSDLLTPRQTEILCCIARGMSTKEVAYHLQLSAKTVETHRAQLMERLKLRDIASLVRYAIRTGLVPLDLASESAPANAGFG
jgi:DNA-binding NarL/FixJ family response regulator